MRHRQWPVLVWIGGCQLTGILAGLAIHAFGFAAVAWTALAVALIVIVAEAVRYVRTH